MLKKIFISIIGFVQLASATSLENILERLESDNHILKEKKSKINSSKIDVDLSNTWSNPVFGIGMNNINIDSPEKRDIEAMQTQYITLSQSIPTNGKLELNREIKEFDLLMNELRYEDNKQKLKSQVISYSYSIVLQKEKFELFNKYLENLSKQKELMNLLYENGKIDQSSLVNLDIKIYKVKLKQQKLLYKIKKEQNNLEKIVYKKINDIELPTTITNLKKITSLNFESHPMIMLKKEQIAQQNKKIKLENSKKISDLKLTVGYYQREEYDDYFSFNVSIPLSTNGREDMQITKSKIDKDSLSESLANLKEQLTSTISDLEAKIYTSKKNFELIDEKMIPLNNTLEQSHQIHLSTNMMQSLGVYESTNSKYELMLLSNDEKISYFDSLSKLFYFKGEL